MTAEDTIDWCNDRLAAFKLPRYIQFRDSLPKTSTERVAKPTLSSHGQYLLYAYLPSFNIA